MGTEGHVTGFGCRRGDNTMEHEYPELFGLFARVGGTWRRLYPTLEASHTLATRMFSGDLSSDRRILAVRSLRSGRGRRAADSRRGRPSDRHSSSAPNRRAG